MPRKILRWSLYSALLSFSRLSFLGLPSGKGLQNMGAYLTIFKNWVRGPEELESLIKNYITWKEKVNYLIGGDKDGYEVAATAPVKNQKG